MRDVDRNRIHSIWGNTTCDFVCCNASKSNSGGLLLIWDVDAFKINNCVKGDRWLIVEGTIVKTQWNCSIGLIYGSHNPKEKSIIFDEIKLEK